MQRIGVFGGTYDPVHNGHLHTAMALVERLGLARLHMVPCYQPVHRDSPSTPTEHRWAMLQQACQSHPALYPDNRELLRAGPSYSIDTMQSLRDEFPAAAIFMFMGADAFRYFGRWYRADDFLQLVNIVVVHRGGEPAPDVAASQWGGAFQPSQSDIVCSRGALTSVQCPLWTTSSTAIRQTLVEGGDIGHDVPAAVAQYIELHQLYR